MKQVVNFRLNEKTISVLAMLEKKLHASKTAIVEKALEMYARKELLQQKRILKFAGSLNIKDADTMLACIRENKHNKDKEIEL
jgi:hypothetical protein